MESQKCGIESDPLTGSSNTSSDSATTIPAFSFDSQTTADNLDHTWEGSSPTEEMEEGGSNTHRNGVSIGCEEFLSSWCRPFHEMLSDTESALYHCSSLLV